MTTYISDADLIRVSIVKVLELENELTAALATTAPSELAAVNSKHPMDARGAIRQKPLAARVIALRSAASKTSPRATAGNQNLKPASPAASSSSAVGAATSTEIPTAQLEDLARSVFGLALPRMEGLSEPQRRYALAVEFWQSNVHIPGLTDRPEVAANNWRPERLTGIPSAIAKLRQQRVNDFLRNIKN